MLHSHVLLLGNETGLLGLAFCYNVLLVLSSWARNLSLLWHEPACFLYTNSETIVLLKSTGFGYVQMKEVITGTGKVLGLGDLLFSP